jgi:hypothetical protein
VAEYYLAIAAIVCWLLAANTSVPCHIQAHR